MRRGIVVGMFRAVNVLTYGGFALWLLSSLVFPSRVAWADAVVAIAPECRYPARLPAPLPR